MTKQEFLIMKGYERWTYGNNKETYCYCYEGGFAAFIDIEQNKMSLSTNSIQNVDDLLNVNCMFFALEQDFKEMQKYE